jgi:diguanylate cyclase (GGDEF)-like protein/PAS domain S-box-containing protein
MDLKKEVSYKLESVMNFFSDYPDPFIYIQINKILYCNKSAIDILGFEESNDLIGCNFYNIIEDKNKIRRVFNNLNMNPIHKSECVFYKKNGDKLKCQISFSKQGENITLFLKEINIEQENVEHLRLFYKVLEKNSEGIVLIDGNDKINWVNSAFTSLTGFREDEIIDKNVETVFDNKDKEFGISIKETIHKSGEFKGEKWLVHKTGERILVYMNIFTIYDDQGKSSYIAAACKDITEDKMKEQKIYELAYKDSLTSLYNREYFMNHILYELKQAKHSNKKLAVLYFDLDNFKSINDTLGHKIGDQVLMLFAKILRESVRSIDVVARLGGDEFVCILPDITNEDEVLRFTDQFIDKFKRPVTIDGHEFYVSSSIGVSLFPDDTYDAEELMHNADIAMYKAKKDRENKVVRFTEKMREDLDEQFKLSNHLRKAIEKNELSIHYQPIVNIRSGEITSAEALLRWNHSIYGYIPPSKFIPIAEANGLIIEIGQWVLKEVCKQNLKWQSLGLKKIPIAVNISVKQLEDDFFISKIKDIIKSTGISPEYLELEMTESISMNNVDKIIKVLKELSALKIKISIDDFGTGYSSLGKLKKLSINKLKIDRSFINDLNEDQETEIVSAIIALANTLGIHIIAEGIETQEQLKFLQSKECYFGQGFLFSEPLELKRFEQVLLN